ncbi:MAG TPA: glycosyltransferase family 39 protein, partial [Thermomicrobiaceae bacterium]|nr:glycosyltransferase family 39 protein [Thermomicrobiaceae bacterium]
MSTTRSRRLSLLFLLAASVVICLALGLRFFGRDWDQGWYMQPDERFMVMVLTDRIHAPDIHHLDRLLDPAHSPLNPRSVDQNGRPQAYAYGSLPLFATDATAAVAGFLTRQDLNSYTRVGLVGRALSALADVITVLLAMILARRLYGRAAALITGLLLATTVTMIQLAHFFTVDSFVTMFATAVLLVALLLVERPTRQGAIAAGILIG